MKREKESLLLGAAPYSNSAPLVERLSEADPRARWVAAPPSRLAAALAEGRLDAALVPVAHLFRFPELEIAAPVGVAADGPVRSVLLRFRRSPARTRRVRRDPASATSNALAALLLGREVRMVDSPAADAEVVIGDRALFPRRPAVATVDLAAAWRERTGLPFVFAVWAVRRDFPEKERVARLVGEARRLGEERLEKIAARFARERGGSAAFWYDYLRRSVHYRLGPRDLAGLRRFRRCLALGRLA